MTHPPDDLERLLRRARPAPRPEFVSELERSLPLRRRKQPRPRLTVALAGAGFAAVLAALVVSLSVAGLLPFSSSGHGAQAEQRCKEVVVERSQRVPQFVQDRRGNIRVRYHTKVVPRLVKRCR